MLIPAAVTSSIAAIPARVAGIFTWMFGASSANRSDCATIAAVSR